MPKPKYFNQALSNLMFDAASGAAICHLADCGYTAGQISKMLDFPTPMDRIKDMVWRHFLDNGTILLDEQKIGVSCEQYAFKAEQDAYGRRSFRKIKVRDGQEKPVLWEESHYSGRADQASLLAYLKSKSAENSGEDGRAGAYVSCDFGLRSRREPERYQESLQRLEAEQQDYLLGLPWERQMAYHRLDARMCGIIAALYGQGCYHGTCYFIKSREKVKILYSSGGGEWNTGMFMTGAGERQGGS